MPRRDPFADKRRTLKGVKPKQAGKKIAAKRTRQKNKISQTERKLKEVSKELTTTERKLAIKQHMLELVSKAPTPAQQRKMIWATFEELGFNPVTELIECAQTIDDPKERATVIEKLSSMVISKPKSVDIEAEIKGGLTITVMDYNKTTQKELQETQKAQTQNTVDQAIDVTPESDEDYAEFISEEERNRARYEPTPNDPNPDTDVPEFSEEQGTDG
jgi:hypothetical protein